MSAFCWPGFDIFYFLPFLVCLFFYFIFFGDSCRLQENYDDARHVRETLGHFAPVKEIRLRRAAHLLFYFFFLLCVRMQLQFACTQSMAISVFLRINWSISFSRKANTRTLPKDTNNLLSIRHTKIWMACNQFGRPRISWAVRSMDRSFVLFVFAKFCVWVASLKLSNVVRWWETRPNWYADKRVNGKMHK